MANFASIQAKIYKGYGKAATRLGSEHAVFRSTDGINPLDPDNFIFNQFISIDQNFKYTTAKKYNDPLWQFLPENGLLLKNYDYLVGSQTTYFVNDVAPADRYTPPTCVECNAFISVYGVGNAPLTPGKNPYQQFQPDTTPGMLVNCPVSILQYTRMESNNMRLPTSVKLPMYSILLPDFDEVEIKTGAVIIDDNGRRMVAITVEQTRKTLGLRILAAELGV